MTILPWFALAWPIRPTARVPDVHRWEIPDHQSSGYRCGSNMTDYFAATIGKDDNNEFHAQHERTIASHERPDETVQRPFWMSISAGSSSFGVSLPEIPQATSSPCSVVTKARRSEAMIDAYPLMETPRYSTFFQGIADVQRMQVRHKQPTIGRRPRREYVSRASDHRLPQSDGAPS